MKYLVFGYIGFDNFGDELIAEVLVQKLKKINAERITLISSNPQKTAKLHNTDSCSMFDFFKHIKQSDILVSGGGSLFQDITSLKSLIYYLTVIFTALALKKEVHLYAQGIGPINTRIGQILTKFILKRVNKITVRDKNSQKLLSNWNIESELVKDPVLELELSKNNNTGILGVQLRKFNGVDNLFLEKLADNIKENFYNKKIQIISLQDSIDLDVCNRFAKILENKDIKDVEVLSGLDMNSVIKIISKLEYLIAMRFHANVIGIKSGVKTIAINYDPKVKSLAEEYNISLIEL